MALIDARAPEPGRPARVGLIVPQRCYTSGQARGGDRHVYAQRTRFIPDTILGHFDAKPWPGKLARPAQARTSPVGAPIDIRARLRQRWG